MGCLLQSSLFSSPAILTEVQCISVLFSERGFTCSVSGGPPPSVECPEIPKYLHFVTSILKDLELNWGKFVYDPRNLGCLLSPIYFLGLLRQSGLLSQKNMEEMYFYTWCSTIKR